MLLLKFYTQNLEFYGIRIESSILRIWMSTTFQCESLDNCFKFLVKNILIYKSLLQNISLWVLKFSISKLFYMSFYISKNLVSKVSFVKLASLSIYIVKLSRIWYHCTWFKSFRIRLGSFFVYRLTIFLKCLCTKFKSLYSSSRKSLTRFLKVWMHNTYSFSILELVFSLLFLCMKIVSLYMIYKFIRESWNVLMCTLNVSFGCMR